MKATVWGCRGSLAAPGPDTIAIGGNTSCLEIRLADDSLLVLDAGTGIRALGLALDGRHQRPLHILLTHLHLDHIEGLGFFAPLWIQEQELHLWGPPSPAASLERRIARYLSPPLFPVTLDEMPARIHFHDFPEREFEARLGDDQSGPGNPPWPDRRAAYQRRQRLACLHPRPRAISGLRSWRGSSQLDEWVRARLPC